MSAKWTWLDRAESVDEFILKIDPMDGTQKNAVVYARNLQPAYRERSRIEPSSADLSARARQDPKAQTQNHREPLIVGVTSESTLHNVPIARIPRRRS